jgi:hypothetical protein
MGRDSRGVRFITSLALVGLIAVEFAAVGARAWAQAQAAAPDGSVRPIQAPIAPAVDIYGAPPLGVQPRLPLPGPVVTPVSPPPPSQTHLPAPLPAPAPTGSPLALDVHPSIGLSGQYNDNFFNTSTSKVDNFRSALSPGLLVGISGPRTLGTVSTVLGIAQDSIDSFGDVHFFPSASVALKHVFDPRFSVSLVDTFSRDDEPSRANQFGLERRRQTFTSNALTLSADWLLDVVATQAYYHLWTFFGPTDTVTNIAGVDAAVPLGAVTTVKAGYEFSFTDTSSPSSSDSTGHLVWASIARRIGPLASVGLSTSHVWQTIESTRISNVSLFAVYELAGRWLFSGSLGYGLLTSDSGGSFPTVTTNTSASYRLGRAVISVAILQDFNQTGLQGEDFGVTLTRSYTGSFGYALTPTIAANLRASYSENEFTGVGNSAGSPNSDALTAGASLVWQVARWLNVGLDYTYTRYNSTPGSTGAIAVNQAGFRIQGVF